MYLVSIMKNKDVITKSYRDWVTFMFGIKVSFFRYNLSSEFDRCTQRNLFRSPHKKKFLVAQSGQI